MTTIEDVAKELKLFVGHHDLAEEWLHNDIVKMKIAMSYDAWLNDIDDHKLHLTLKEHIETCLDEPGYIGIHEKP